MSGRIRSIKPEWLEDEAMLSCSAAARVVSIGLILLADDHGRGRGSLVYLSSRIFPFAESTETLANGLAELVKIRFVELYRLSGQTYYAIRNWAKHQRVDKPGKPRVPGPLDEGVEKIRETLAKVPETLATDPDPDPDPDQDQDHDQDPCIFPLAKTAHTEVEARSALTITPAARETGKTGSKKAAKGVRSDAEQEAARMVRETFKASYARRYMLPLTAWGAPENSHLYHLLKTWPVAELVVMARRYFEWAHKGAIDAGHPFMNHRASFSALVHELKADIVAPERRQQSAAVEQQRKEQDVRAANADAMDRATKLLQEQANGIMGRSSGTEPALRDAESGNRTLGGRTRQADERGGAGTLAETLAAARRIGPVPGA